MAEKSELHRLFEKMDQATVPPVFRNRRPWTLSRIEVRVEGKEDVRKWCVNIDTESYFHVEPADTPELAVQNALAALLDDARQGECSYDSRAKAARDRLAAIQRAIGA